MKQLLLTILLLISITIFAADPPGDPNGGNGHHYGWGGGSAPIESGLLILIGISIIYGTVKYNNIKYKKLNNEN